jgi:hypothetical protein
VLRARMLKGAADYELMAEVADNFTDNAGEPNLTKNVQQIRPGVGARYDRVLRVTEMLAEVQMPGFSEERADPER